MKMERQLIIQNTTKQELIQDLTKALESRTQQKESIKEVLYISDVARKLKRSINSVRNLVRSKKIEYLQEKPGSVIMFYDYHIEDYLKSIETISYNQEAKEIQSFINKPFGHGNNKH